jgi:protoporphyrinogen oxidase
MRKAKYLILGAGPSGLALAHTLHDQGVPLSEILVLEREDVAGGLCRSAVVDDAPLDIGGGHFLDIKHQEVLDLVFRFLPESEWNRHNRISKINMFSRLVDHPYEANLWQLDFGQQLDYIESIAQAGCVRDLPVPESFASWIRWKFGERIADDYMLPYNRKIWSMDPDDLGTYWLYKLPNVSFRETVASCLQGKPFGSLPAHGVFLYPKHYGYGEVWKRMGEALGDSLVTGVNITSVDLPRRSINETWQADVIFNSVPWHHWLKWTDVDTAVSEDIAALINVSIDVDYVPETLPSDAHWIYEPDESLAHHRKLLRSNFSPGSQGYWTESNSRRSEAASGWRHTNEYAYPVNTIRKPRQISRILDWAKGHGVIGFGRWGTWEHMNSDIAVKSAIRLGIETVGNSRSK